MSSFGLTEWLHVFLRSLQVPVQSLLDHCLTLAPHCGRHTSGDSGTWGGPRDPCLRGEGEEGGGRREREYLPNCRGYTCTITLSICAHTKWISLSPGWEGRHAWLWRQCQPQRAQLARGRRWRGRTACSPRPDTAAVWRWVASWCSSGHRVSHSPQWCVLGDPLAVEMCLPSSECVYVIYFTLWIPIMALSLLESYIIILLSEASFAHI